MSAEVLRQAAALMRERAEDATPGPWRDIPMGSEGSIVLNGDNSVRGSRKPATCREFADATHIASWHPAVALAVADWLKSVAADVDKRDNPKRVGGRFEAIRIPDEHAALAVARAYLGTQP